MRILHTSDWHAGKVWKGRKRLDELERVLDHLLDFARHDGVDLLIHSGDIFDTPSPSAEAERLVFHFFKELGGSAGIPSLAIAGNHDGPARLSAWGLLSELVDCQVVAKPLTSGDGGVLELQAKNGQLARIAAVPFAGARQLVSALELMDDEEAARAKTYPSRMGHIFRQLSATFRPDAVNLLTAHAFVGGCELSQSERRVHVGEDWALEPETLPSAAHYVAMGHVHKPQRLRGCDVEARYAGSALQLDFGEVDETKSFVVVEATAGGPVHVETVPYQGAVPLVDRRATFEEIEAQADSLAKAGWLRLTVPLSAPDPETAGRIRHLLPNALVIRLELPPAATPGLEPGPPAGASAPEMFEAYYRREHGRSPDDALVEVFKDLYRQSGGL